MSEETGSKIQLQRKMTKASENAKEVKKNTTKKNAEKARFKHNKRTKK